MRFKAALVDLRKKTVIASFPVIRATSQAEAKRFALKRLKKRRIYKVDPDVQEFVRINEMGDDFSVAGHEFDVLPEAIRRFALEISILDKE